MSNDDQLTELDKVTKSKKAFHNNQSVLREIDEINKSIAESVARLQVRFREILEKDITAFDNIKPPPGSDNPEYTKFLKSIEDLKDQVRASQK